MGFHISYQETTGFRERNVHAGDGTSFYVGQDILLEFFKAKLSFYSACWKQI